MQRHPGIILDLNWQGCVTEAKKKRDYNATGLLCKAWWIAGASDVHVVMAGLMVLFTFAMHSVGLKSH